MTISGSKNRVIILGSDGMLGADMCDRFSAVNPITTTRRPENITQTCAMFNGDVDNLARSVGIDFDYVINCVATIRPASLDSAMSTNYTIPKRLAEVFRHSIIIQPGTDGVFTHNNTNGCYTESTNPTPAPSHEFYNLSKIAIEGCRADNLRVLRTSIIGDGFLVKWVLGHSGGASVGGFANSLWNGVTTNAFAELCHAIVRDDFDTGHLLHVIPEGFQSKFDLICKICRRFGRGDLTVEAVEEPHQNLILGTDYPDLLKQLWANTRYEYAPTLDDMLTGLFLDTVPHATGFGFDHIEKPTTPDTPDVWFIDGRASVV